MHFGLFCLMPQRDRSRTPRAIYQDTLEDVLAAEAAGFEIAWFAEPWWDRKPPLVASPVREAAGRPTA